MQITHHITSFYRQWATSKDYGQIPQWVCTTQEGDKIWVTDHPSSAKNSIRPFKEVRFYDDWLHLMEVGETLKFKTMPIAVFAVMVGTFWKVIEVAPLPDGLQPDKPKTPDFDLFKKHAVEVCHMLVKTSSIVLFVDTEGDSLDTGVCQIVQLGICKFNQYQKSLYIRPDEHNQLLTVGKSGKSATDVHGLTPAFLDSYPGFKDQAFLIKTLLGEAVWCIYNSSYDMPVIENNYIRNELTPPIPLGYVDLMKVVSYYFGVWNEQYEDWTSIKLEDACERLGVTIGKAHDALSDAVACRDIVNAICRLDYLESNAPNQVEMFDKVETTEDSNEQ